MKNWIHWQKFSDNEKLVETSGFLSNIDVNVDESNSIFKSSFNEEGPFNKKVIKKNRIGFKYSNRK